MPVSADRLHHVNQAELYSCEIVFSCTYQTVTHIERDNTLFAPDYQNNSFADIILYITISKQ